MFVQAGTTWTSRSTGSPSGGTTRRANKKIKMDEEAPLIASFSSFISLETSYIYILYIYVDIYKYAFWSLLSALDVYISVNSSVLHTEIDWFLWVEKLSLANSSMQLLEDHPWDRVFLCKIPMFIAKMFFFVKFQCLLQGCFSL